MKKKEENIIKAECNCKQVSVNEIASAVDEVLERTGRDREKVILVLQQVQDKLGYLPSEALKHICKVSEITPRTNIRSIDFLLTVQAYSFR